MRGEDSFFWEAPKKDFESTHPHSNKNTGCESVVKHEVLQKQNSQGRYN